MSIVTSRYGNKSIDNKHYMPIQISLGHPRFRITFQIEKKFPELMPTRDMLRLEEPEYRFRYFEMLESKQAEIISRLTTLRQIADESGYRDIVLLCFEDLSKESAWCHRRLFAEWWQALTKETIKELQVQIFSRQGGLFE